MIYERLQARFVTLKNHTKLCGAIFLRLGTQFDVFDLRLSLQKPSLIINRLRDVIILKIITLNVSPLPKFYQFPHLQSDQKIVAGLRS